MKKILLIDNFDSFTFNLVDYFKQLGCKVEIHRNTMHPAEIENINPDLIVFSPGPSIPSNAGNMMKMIEMYKEKYAMFGVCLGHQAFIEAFGGKLKFIEPVHGKSSEVEHDGKGIFANIPQNFKAGRYHSLVAEEVPDCFEVSAKTGDIVMAIRHKELPIIGVQFHPESVLSMRDGNGFKLIANLICENFIEKTVANHTTPEEQKDYLENLEITAEKLAEFAKSLLPEKLNMPEAIDLCGTGGSGLNRINTSTISAFLANRAGVKIAKHGNKAASGRFGSFDLLEAMEVDFKDPEKDFAHTGLAFIYARQFHPAMKHFAAVRKEIKGKTIFNLLGPLLNPAQPERQIIGVSSKEDMQIMIEACQLLGKKHVLVVHGSDGLDEVTLTGKTFVAELFEGKIKHYEITPEDFGLTRCEFEKIEGGENLKIAQQILNGECQTRHLDLALLNTALILHFTGKAKNYKEALELAQKLAIAPSTKSFKNALKNRALICEFKRKSPSQGQLSEKTPQEVVDFYEANGAAALSILTNKERFNGSVKDLSVKTNLPILMKDFITTKEQIYAGRKHGANAILLIAALLDAKQIDEFIMIARSLKMHALVEVHNKEELEKVLTTKAEIIGVNNRNLETLEIDIRTALKLLPLIPKDKITVAESGYNKDNIHFALADAALIGTALIKDPESLKEMKGKIFKACGIRTKEAAEFCEAHKIPLAGLNFVASSKRKITLEQAKELRPIFQNTLVAGIFQNQDLEEVNRIAAELNLDFVQLSGQESPEYCAQIDKPLIKTITSQDQNDYKAALYIIDGHNPGSGQTHDLSLINIKRPFLIAGGITPDNASRILSRLPNSLGIDVASGIESDGQTDNEKISKLQKSCK